MSDLKVEDGADLSGHVVALNNLMNRLNREARQTYLPNHKEIANIVHSMKMHASVIESIMLKELK